MARPADPNAKSALVAAARREFARAGIKGARIEDITAACQLAKGSFYLHYPSKEALFAELVEDFRAQIDQAVESRARQVQQFRAEVGALGRVDPRQRVARYRKFMALEAQLDRELLQIIWQHREVVEVLISGSQGTDFAGLVWQVLDLEVERVARDVELAQRAGVIRADVPARVYGSMTVGTYLMIARQLARLPEPPDLDVWVQALHRLVREGCAPVPLPRGKVKVAGRVRARAVKRNQGGVA